MKEFIQYVKKLESALDEYSCYPTIDNWQKLVEIKAIVHYLAYSDALNQKEFQPGQPAYISLN